MSKRFTTVLMAIFTGMFFLTVGILTAADVPVPDEVLIENSYKADKKGPVKFTHKKHNVDYTIACIDCHHEAKDGKQVAWKEGDKVEKCRKCHDPEKGEKGEPMKLQNAFHKNCKDCHKALEKEGKKTGPFKKCNDCHEKK